MFVIRPLYITSFSFAGTYPLKPIRSVGLIDEIDHHLRHYVFLLRTALCNHQRKSHEGVVCYALGTVFTIEYAVVVHKPEEERGSDALVAVGKAVVLGYEVKQHSRLFLHTGIEFLATESLVYLPDV